MTKQHQLLNQSEHIHTYYIYITLYYAKVIENLHTFDFLFEREGERESYLPDTI